jgi:hypothetical protein
VDRAVTEFGHDRNWSDAQILKAKRICYRTIWTESDWRNLANPSVPESLQVIPNDGFGKDLNSTGLYQQRAQWWGTVVGSMDPYTATVRFMTRLPGNSPYWFTVDESTSCQLVQQSQFDGVKINPATGKPYPFAQNYKDRQAQTDALAADELYFTHRGV